uniref:gamma-tubulin complex component 4 n=1 Tax=Myxine glutinosa TaxID=7769 RepID=UPI00358F5972
MIHELLLALSGFPGAVFVWKRTTGLQVVQDFPFVHPSEVDLLNRICRLGTYYIQFSEFIRQNTSQACKAANHGMYLRAFCSGLRIVLQPYRQAILELEQQFMSDPHLTITHISYSLEQFQLLFPSLMSITEYISSQKVRGCKILEVIHKHSLSGLPPTCKALQRIMWDCHGVLYQQLSAWLLHGLLLDPHQEFFLQHKCPSRSPDPQASDNPSSSKVRVEKEEEEAFANGKQMSQGFPHQDVAKCEGSSPSATALFTICPLMLPSYIPMHLAENILFIGHSIQVFDGDAGACSTPDLEESMQKFNNKTGPCCRSGWVQRTHEDSFALQLQQLKESQEFILADLENVVDKIRNAVAEHLWRLVVEDADLLGQLKLMKDFFLLGRGELFQAFIDTTQQLLKHQPTAVTAHDVNIAFQKSAQKVLLDDEPSLMLFRLTISSPNSQSPELQQSATGWSLLGLTYEVRWPLHILLTPSILERYNTIFHHLLEVRRVQTELQQCWATQMQRKRVLPDKVDAEKWRLRNHMAFLVDNLQYYLQVDVLEVQFSRLLQKIGNEQDFESARLTHDAFLANLLAQSFILLKPVFRCLHEILILCHAFCVVATSPVAPSQPSQARTTTKLSNLIIGFSKQSSFLFKIISSVRSHQSNPHLSQLLLRLDYNRFYTQAGGTLGSFAL